MKTTGRRVCLSLGASQQNTLYDELLAGVDGALRALGHLPWRADEPTADALSSDVLLLLGAGKQFNAFAAPLAARTAHPRVVLWLIEPLPPPQLGRLSGWLTRALLGWPGAAGALGKTLAEGALSAALTARGCGGVHPEHMLNRLAWLQRNRNAAWLDEVVTTTRAKARTLDSMGFPARFCPMGYAPVLGRNLGIERDIDVLFVGGVGKRHRRRRETLERMRAHCEQAGLRFEISSQTCHGAEREQLINRAKIFLNLAKYPWDLSIERFLMGAGAGALVLSENLDDATPFVAGRDYVCGSLDELPELAVRWLADHAGRAGIIANADRLIRGELDLSRCVARLLDPHETC